ncbi:hypothetical protein SO802_016644 [Lithocarpus litseifolius]|uniref:Uncharacterized protein n=1 Tax=Lithocarpus litseifolius TaxID=425828 RepID=A0AAW2CZB0_9ROSI
MGLQLVASTMSEMVIYVPIRIVPYGQVEKLVTMEENSLVVANLMTSMLKNELQLANQREMTTKEMKERSNQRERETHELYVKAREKVRDCTR